jgi:putative copper resistance protein D
VLVLAEFIDSLLRGALLIGLSMVFGSTPWALWVLRRLPAAIGADARARCLRVLEAGAGVVALSQVILLALKALVLSESLGPGAFEAFAGTAHFAAGAARTVLGLLLVAAARGLRRAPLAAGRWGSATVLAMLLAASGSWLTHASGRLEHRGALMTITVLHQVAAGAWLGGLIQTAIFWRLVRRRADVDAVWPPIVARFSSLAVACVCVLIVSAIPLAWVYTGRAQALIGTGYGSLVVTKVVLLGMALLLAAFNFLAVRRGSVPSAFVALRARLPYLVEAEAIILFMILFAATALSAQPPAADVPPTEQATVVEVAEVFRPKLPSLQTPSVEAMRRDRTEPTGERSREAYRWSNFSHNVAGLILLAMSLVALAGFATGRSWGRHWPLGFLPLAAFMYLRAAANEGTWPFGATSLAEVGAEGIQHRIAAALVVALGVVEWWARRGGRERGLLVYVFPALGAAGAVLLLAHSHAAFQLKSSFLVQVTHSTMGALAGLMVAARWLELRLTPSGRRVAGAAASVAMLMIAFILVFYREANVVVPAD